MKVQRQQPFRAASYLLLEWSCSSSKQISNTIRSVSTFLWLPKQQSWSSKLYISNSSNFVRSNFDYTCFIVAGVRSVLTFCLCNQSTLKAAAAINRHDGTIVRSNSSNLIVKSNPPRHEPAVGPIVWSIAVQRSMLREVDKTNVCNANILTQLQYL